ncbi:beta-lactamase-like protein [Truncatella angustata]|uniref:Cleavage and polyadenylation specificity factor subunit 2 n=1 Tax=Truncatella angustata TaxID=152316 RepID=A0A9P8ZY61_9PEZI|nr:beta-lactamase-like protein [Truncatella angustata]KAH6654679.1 beta-lactamase-like protein [Truncatella angustata]
MFTFTPLQGAKSDSTAVQSILELDGGVKVLVDVGWDEAFDPQQLRELEKQVPTLSLVLLTHATVSHLGAFAHCCKHIPLFARIPVYATTPVIALGRTLLQELYISTPLAATTIPKSSLNEVSYSYNAQAAATESNILLQPPTNDEIAKYFSLINSLKYLQPHQPVGSPFSPPLNGLTITAYNSGSTLGGTIWHIQHGLESIVYAVDWNQGRENVYAGAAWLGGAGGGGTEVIESLRKPTALVCSSKGATKSSLPRAKRDEPLLESIEGCISNGGTVLIPVDSGARVLELAYLLEHAWRRHAAKDGGKLHSAELYLAGRGIHSTMRYARSMLEWMDERIAQEFEEIADVNKRPNGATNGTSQKDQGSQGGPFDFRYLKLLDRRGQVDKVLSRPNGDGSVGKVILASDSSLEWGFSKDVFKALVQDPKNLLVLTGLPTTPTGGSTTLSSTFYKWWRESVEENEKHGAEAVGTGIGTNGALIQVPGKGREATLRDAQKEPLEGDDLAVYRFWLAQQRQLQDTVQTGGTETLDANLDIDDASSESSSDSGDSETHQQGKVLNVAATLGRATRKKALVADEDLGPNILLKKKGVYDYDLRGKSGRDAMFPYPVQRKRADDYGDLIRLEDFLKTEEQQDDDQHGLLDGKEDLKDNLGKKRKWTDSAPNKGLGTDKRPKLERNASDDFEMAIADGPVINELDDVPDDEEDTSTGPFKLALTTEQVTINMNITFIDFSGIHDKRSLQMLIPLIQPRKLVLTGGSSLETEELSTEMPKIIQSQIDIFMPEIGSTVDASADTNAYSVNLAPALVKGLKWQDVGGVKIATLVGRLSMADENKDPVLDIPMTLASGLAATQSVTPFHVGDLRLGNLRKDLRDSGYSTEFMGEGTLLVQNSVIVRKAANAGRITVEAAGWETDTVQTVRKMVYEKLAVVGH